VKQLGGIAIVQDPLDAVYSSMPQNAVDHVQVDHVAPLAAIAPLLVDLTAVPPQAMKEVAAAEQLDIEVKIAMEHNPIDAGLERLGEPSLFACPECHGVLLQLKEGSRIRFRCHTGHAYSVASLLAAISEGIEDSLWGAIRALEEGQLLMRRVADRLKLAGSEGTDAEALVNGAEEARRQSDAIRRIVMQREPLPVKSK